MYQTIFVDKRIELTPKELSDARTAEHIRDILVTKLKEQEEGKCNAEGYIRPGSIQLLRRSMGVAENGKFTGNWIFDCKIRCEILKPVAYDPKDPDNTASVLTFKVIDLNKAGVMASLEEAIQVLLPRDTHARMPEFDALKVGDVIQVRMIRHRFQTNDPFIAAVGELATETKRLPPNVQRNDATEEEQEEEGAEEAEEAEGAEEAEEQVAA